MHPASIPLATPDLDLDPVGMVYELVAALGRFFAGTWPYLLLAAAIALSVLFTLSWLIRRWTAHRDATADDATSLLTPDEEIAQPTNDDTAGLRAPEQHEAGVTIFRS